MSFANDVITRLYLNGDWRDISSHVRAEAGVTYKRGRQGEEDTTPPQECTLVLDNGTSGGDGDYTERNPMGQWYGYLGRFTPAQVALRTVKDTCSTTVSSGWGSTDTHSQGAWSVESWATSSGSATDYNKAAGKATQFISAAGQLRICYLSNFRARDLGIKLTWSASVSNVTGSSLGAGLCAANVLVHGQGAASTYYMLRQVIQTDESIVLDWFSHTGTSLTGGTFTSTGLTYSSAQSYYTRVEAEGRTLRAKTWQVGTAEPFGWTLTFTDEGDQTTTDTMRDVQGWAGVRSSLISGNTNTNVTVSYDDIEIYSLIATGEVNSWPQGRDQTGLDQTVQVTIGGPKRRLTASKTLARSALYQRFMVNSLGGFLPTPDAYYPLEDGPQTVAEQVLPTAGRGRLKFTTQVTSTTVGKVTWAADSSRPGAKQSPAVTGGGALIAFVEPVTSTTRWGVYWQVKHNYSDGSFVTMGTAEGSPILIDVRINATSTLLQVELFSAGVFPMMSYDYGSKEEVEKWHTIGIEAWQTGPDIGFFLYVDGVQQDSYTYAGQTLQGMHRVHLGTADNAPGNTYYGHLAIFGDLVANVDPEAMHEAALGNPGERPVFRAKRIAEEYGYNLDWIGLGGANGGPTTFVGDGKPMGPQRVTNLQDLLNDTEKVDGGLLYEQRSRAAFQFRTLHSMGARTSWCSLNMGTSKHLSDLTPTSDDRALVNRFTATRAEGGESVYSLDSGPMSTLSPDEGGVGVMDRGESFNVDNEEDLPDIARFQVAKGTVDQERYVPVVVELHRSAVYGTSGLLAKLRDLDIGDQVTLEDLQSNGIYDDRDVLVLGVDGQLDLFRHTLRLTTTPAELLRVWTLGSTVASASEFTRLDSDYTTLNEDLTTTETDVTVAIESGKAFWVDSTSYSDRFPFDVITGGEVMRVTAGTTPSGQTQTWTVTRSVNGVVKTHSTGQKISLYKPNYLGL